MIDMFLVAESRQQRQVGDGADQSLAEALWKQMSNDELATLLAAIRAANPASKGGKQNLTVSNGEEQEAPHRLLAR